MTAPPSDPADLLVIGDRIYSSWSLRGWLLWAAFGRTVPVRLAPLFTPEFSPALDDLGVATTVPAARIGGAAVWDSVAIAETLAERWPDMWPTDPAMRAAARSLVAEMHAGFQALRRDCPMNLRHRFEGRALSDAVRADLARIEALWDWAFALGSAPGPDPDQGWLFGAYSIADAFFAPVAARIAGFALPVGAQAQAYVARHLAHPPFRRWRAMGLADAVIQDRYEFEAPTPWPGPAPRPAKPVTGAAPENEACPFSGRRVDAASLAEIDGRIFGFCNPWCRDKAVADPDAWPEVTALLHR
ncbi:MAG: glutathione S-transferase [Pseudomonadota bacterium]